MTISPSSLEGRSSPLWLQLDAFQALFEEFGAIDAPTPEEEARYGEAFEAFKESCLDKVDACASWIERQEDEAHRLAARAKSLERRSKAKTAAAERLREGLIYTLNSRNIPSIGGVDNDYKMSVQRNSVATLTISSQRDLPPEYEMAEYIVRVPMTKLSEAEAILQNALQERRLISVTQAKEMPNTRAIRVALEAGKTVHGCKLERGSHLRIS